ncbi:protein kinase [Candidatus Riflebacteria bacterium]
MADSENNNGKSEDPDSNPGTEESKEKVSFDSTTVVPSSDEQAPADSDRTIISGSSPDITQTAACESLPAYLPRISERYTEIKLLGEGGMGAVLSAFDSALKRPIAIKVLKKELLHNASLFNRFQNEAELTASVDHPNIVKIFDISADPDNPYFVMENFPGKALKSVISREELPLKRCVNIFLQIIRGLKAAHEMALLHRDIKPENILINKEDHVKIIDFGLSKLESVEETIAEATPEEPDNASSGARERHVVDNRTQAGTVLGSPYFMSPEQCQGKTDLTYKTDVYSAGATFFTMLTGEYPFSANSIGNLMQKHCNEPRPKVIDFNEEHPVELSDLISRMMAIKPEQRPDYEEIMEKLEALHVQLFTDENTLAQQAIAKTKIMALTGIIVFIVAALIFGYFKGWFSGHQYFEDVDNIKNMLARSIKTRFVKKAGASSEENSRLAEAERYLKLAAVSLNENKGNQAFLHVMQSLLNNPDNPESLTFIKTFKVHPGQKKKSLFNLKRALSLQRKNPKAALKDLNIALSLDPTNVEIYRKIATINFELKYYDEAEKYLAFASFLKPSGALTFFIKGKIAAEKTLFKRAFEFFGKAIKASPEAWNYYFERGLVYQSLKKLESALQDFTKSLELKKKSEVYMARVDCYLKLEKQDLAVRDLHAAFLLNPKDVGPILTISKMYKESFEGGKAIQFLNDGLKLQPRSVPLLLQRSTIFAWQKKLKSSLADIEKAQQLAPGSPEVFDAFGQYYEQADKLPAAQEYYSKAIKVKPTSELYQARARLYNRWNKFEKAMDDCNQALKLKPDNDLALVSRGIANDYLGRAKEALNDFNKAYYLRPNYIYLHYFRGRFFYRAGNFENAIKDLDKILARKKEHYWSYYYRALTNKALGHHDKSKEDMKRFDELKKKIGFGEEKAQ